MSEGVLLVVLSVVLCLWCAEGVSDPGAVRAHHGTHISRARLPRPGWFSTRRQRTTFRQRRPWEAILSFLSRVSPQTHPLRFRTWRNMNLISFAAPIFSGLASPHPTPFRFISSVSHSLSLHLLCFSHPFASSPLFLAPVGLTPSPFLCLGPGSHLQVPGNERSGSCRSSWSWPTPTWGRRNASGAAGVCHPGRWVRKRIKKGEAGGAGSGPWAGRLPGGAENRHGSFMPVGPYHVHSPRPFGPSRTDSRGSPTRPVWRRRMAKSSSGTPWTRTAATHPGAMRTAGSPRGALWGRGGDATVALCGPRLVSQGRWEGRGGLYSRPARLGV